MSKLRLVVLGAGHLGMIHARLAQQHAGVELIGVVDPLPEARARVRQEWGALDYADLADLPQRPDAAIIATPSSLHYEIAQPLIARGLHLLIEKPVTVELQQALILARLAARFQSTVAVGHVERFNPAWQGIADCIGPVRYFESQRLSGYTFRSTDVGVVLDLMIHDLDLLASLVRSSARQIEAWGTWWLSPDEDMASARIEFECGAVGQLTAGRCSPEALRKVWLVGEEGQARVDLANRQIEVVKRTRQADTLHGAAGAWTAAERAQAREAMFRDYLPRSVQQIEPANAILEEQRDWLEAIRQQRAPRVDLNSACRSLAWAEKICTAIRAREALRGERNEARQRPAA